MTTDHDPLTGLSNALDDEPRITVAPLPAWIVEQLDLEHRRQQRARPLIEMHLRHLDEGKITLDEFGRYVRGTIEHVHTTVDP